ncbi:SDR family oxidoreductase [soil metagenome]
MSDKYVIIVTGASSGFGLLSAKKLAHAGHTVYATMRETLGRNAPQVAAVAQYAQDHKVDLRTVELDVANDASVEAGVAKVIADNGRLDVIIHNAGHMSFGPAEAFTPEQFGQLYDINVLSTQRVNRAALPQLRKQGRGLLVWIGSSSTRGGTPPFLSPYFAAKAAMDALAASYSTELALWGIETTIIVPGAFTKGTNHFAHSGAPADKARVAEYEEGPYAGIADKALKGLASLEPADADPEKVADAVVEVVDAQFGKRPFRVHIDPSEDGAEIVNGVADRVRREMYRNIDLENLLSPAQID